MTVDAVSPHGLSYSIARKRNMTQLDRTCFIPIRVVVFGHHSIHHILPEIVAKSSSWHLGFRLQSD
jgi:hypothetical protein